MKKKLFFTTGLPRSGKSTLRRRVVKLVEKYYSDLLITVSADDLRFICYGERYNQEKEPEVWRVRERLLRMLMGYGISIIIDETNTTEKRRSHIIKLGKEYGYEIICLSVDSPPNICKDRALALKDTKIIPIIAEQANYITKPNLNEGINLLIEFSCNIDSYSDVDIRNLLFSAYHR